MNRRLIDARLLLGADLREPAATHFLVPNGLGAEVIQHFTGKEILGGNFQNALLFFRQIFNSHISW